MIIRCGALIILSNDKLEDVIVRLFKHFGKWRFSIEFGKYRMGGTASSMLEAEEKAFLALSELPKHGIINIVYEDGKPVEVEKGKMPK